MMRRIDIEDIEDTLQRQTYYLVPDRYRDLFLAGEFSSTPQPLSSEETLEEEVVGDIDELDKFFDAMESGRSMTGAELISRLDPDEEGWV